MSEIWEFVDNENLISESDIPCWSGDDGDADAEQAAWLRGLPDEVRADYLAGAWTGAGESEAAGFLHDDHEPSARGFAAGGACDTMPPGPDLARMVAATIAYGYAELGESELIGVLCGWQRLISWAQAGQAAAITGLTERRKQQSAELDRPNLIGHLDDELAAALHLTGRSAERLLSTAAGLARLGEVQAALSCGEIDWARACLFLEQLAALPDDAANEIVSSLLGRAAGMTTGQLRAALARAILAADPGAAEQRKEAARKEAEVQAWSEPSGNAALIGRELRPSDVVTANEFLSAHARWLKSCGADGSVDQLRAAVFVALLNGRPVQSLVPPSPEGVRDTRPDEPGPTEPGPTEPGPTEPDRVGAQTNASTGCDWLTGTINLTMPLSTWLGMSDSPGELAGYGPTDAVTCRQLAEAMGRDSQWCLTLIDAAGRATAHACAAKGPGRSPDRCTGIRWTADMRERLELLETPPCGHGRQSGSYKPPRSLRHLVVIRQRTCSFPGCRRAARRCDLDHTVPFDQGGRTCECNLAPLCRRHHQGKQAPGWQLTQARPGEMTWRTPSGRVYETTGDPY
jgi:hypothetical protein